MLDNQNLWKATPILQLDRQTALQLQALCGQATDNLIYTNNVRQPEPLASDSHPSTGQTDSTSTSSIVCVQATDNLIYTNNVRQPEPLASDSHPSTGQTALQLQALCVQATDKLIYTNNVRQPEPLASDSHPSTEQTDSTSTSSIVGSELHLHFLLFL